jgi:membrane complex biogenesis BtpA family protein
MTHTPEEKPDRGADLPEWKQEWNRPRIKSLADLFPAPKPVIGMVHLWPLPGAPGYTGYTVQKIVDHAMRDAEALVGGGVDGLMVENMWDLPYNVGAGVKPEAMTAHAVVAAEIVKNFPVPVGINVIHNGGVVCLSIAVASGARFIRVCILTGARVWDTGEFDHGCAAELLRKRKELHAEGIHIFADVDKKHSVPFPGIDLATHIEWTEFYGADALIVSGSFTGKSPDLEKVREAKRLAHRPLLIGSGTTIENVSSLLEFADGIIIGTGLKKDGVMENPVDPARVRALLDRVRSFRQPAATPASAFRP